MFDSVFWVNEKGATLPAIAERWELAPDTLSWIFYIRKGVKFHNGEDLTADDVKFSIERYLAKDTQQPDVRGAVLSVEKVDDYTVRVYTNGPQPLLLNFLGEANPGEGFVIPKDYVEQHGIDYFERNPVGSGPWKYVRRVQGDFTEYEAAGQQWRQAPTFKTLTVILMPEDTTRVASLKTGEVDAIEVTLEGAIDLERAGLKTFRLDMTTPQVQFHGVFDSRAAGMPITDIRVRQALSLATNRDEIINSFFYGKGLPPMPPYISPGSMDIDAAYWQDYCAKLYRYNLDEAKQLLTAAGYPNGFSVKMYTFAPPGAPYLPKLAEILQAYWAKVGVKLELVPVDFSVYTTNLRNPSGKGPAPELIGQLTLHRNYWSDPLTPKSLSSCYASGASNSLADFGMPELDKLITNSMTEMNTAKRKDLLAQAIKMGTDSFVAFQICAAPSMGALGPRVDWDFPQPVAIPAIPLYANIAKHAQ
jgi:peptide/nickel transport system substrate-binding protein